MGGSHRRRLIPVALLAALVLMASTCGSGGSSEGSSKTRATAADAGKPTPGGKVVYGVESDTGGGFCLPAGQLAISGVMVAESVYDPLTWPNKKGEYVPYLAESVTPNADFTQWTIKLRPNITFHDGTPLDADTVKLNLDTYRGQNPNISSTLFSHRAPADRRRHRRRPAHRCREDEDALGGVPRLPLQLRPHGNDGQGPARRTRTPARANSSGPVRSGSTGSWTPGTPVELKKNKSYWRKDQNGVQLPYLDAITFVGVVESSQRITQLEGGQLDIMHTDFEPDLKKLQDKADSGAVKLTIGHQGREIRYYMLNAGKATVRRPQGTPGVRHRPRSSGDQQLRNLGQSTIANGPFDKDVMGYVANPGFPKHDLEKAKKLVKEVKAAHGDFKVTFVVLPDTENRNEAELLKQQLSKAGIAVDIRTVDQTAEISTAIGGDYDVLLWRNHPGEDPDTEYTWWHTGEPTNFSKINDPEIDRLLDEGRTNADPATRAAAYKGITKEFAKQVWNVWAWYVDWGIATRPNVNGILGPPLPDGSRPYPILAGSHPTLGIWVKR